MPKQQVAERPGHSFTPAIGIAEPHLSREVRAVATVFCAHSAGWPTKGEFIDRCDGISDRASALLVANLRPGIRILDLGAGAGKVADKVLSAEPTAKLVLVDHAPGMVRVLSERFSESPQVTIICADLQRIREVLGDQQFDLITLFQVLHHVPYPGAALRVAARHLRQGGRAIILTPGPRYQETIFPRTSRDGLGRRQISSWLKLAEAAGLDIESVHNDSFAFHFRNGVAYAHFLHRVGSLEKLARYRLLTGEQLDRGLSDAALRATKACADAEGGITVPCEHVTIVARRFAEGK